ncbi:MAG TPA: UDP-N-acetylmuramoyl-tripeptide--D-alanyl-D-alanine ligase, partial [Chitinophagaceae bacterium]|nr:UDP-N-acetylmuramoyl-tripeptide--D-alanyl-D-alanine ligase [Chitinophagaceae bacterium]
MMIEKLYQVYKQNPFVQTDTRQLKSGEIFFALKGPNFNGNSFAAKALEMDAAAVVVDEETGIEDDRLFKVPDALQALQQLALHHRNQFNIPFLAITGSNGKTTTKELVFAVLNTTYKTTTTKGNLNNHIGVPLTILSIPPDAEMAVIEMGANHQKEIASYCTYTLPTHGIITNCGKAHLEGFGGVEGVRKGKGELFDHLRANQGTAFIMWDYDYFHPMSKGIKHIVTYGTQDADFMGYLAASEPFLVVDMQKGSSVGTITTHLVGEYNLPNVLVAVAVGEYFKVPASRIKAAIESYEPNNSRSQLVIRDSNTFILDAYNANPTSMRAAIENFAKQHHPSKYICIGGMMELGTESAVEHQGIIELLEQHEWKDVLLVGGDFAHTKHRYRFFPDANAAASWFKDQNIREAMFLVKGSRSMK